jgi:hypothetical protein
MSPSAGLRVVNLLALKYVLNGRPCCGSRLVRSVHSVRRPRGASDDDYVVRDSGRAMPISPGAAEMGAQLEEALGGHNRATLVRVPSRRTKPIILVPHTS